MTNAKTVRVGRATVVEALSRASSALAAAADAAWADMGVRELQLKISALLTKLEDMREQQGLLR